MRYERSHAITERHQNLVGLIRRAPASAPVLAEQLGVSEQTVYRDVRYLKRHGFPILSIKHSEKWAYHLAAESPKRKEGRRP